MSLNEEFSFTDIYPERAPVSGPSAYLDLQMDLVRDNTSVSLDEGTKLLPPKAVEWIKVSKPFNSNNHKIQDMVLSSGHVYGSAASNTSNSTFSIAQSKLWSFSNILFTKTPSGAYKVSGHKDIIAWLESNELLWIYGFSRKLVKLISTRIYYALVHWINEVKGDFQFHKLPLSIMDILVTMHIAVCPDIESLNKLEIGDDNVLGELVQNKLQASFETLFDRAYISKLCMQGFSTGDIVTSGINSYVYHPNRASWFVYPGRNIDKIILTTGVWFGRLVDDSGDPDLNRQVHRFISTTATSQVNIYYSYMAYGYNVHPISGLKDYLKLSVTRISNETATSLVLSRYHLSHMNDLMLAAVMWYLAVWTTKARIFYEGQRYTIWLFGTHGAIADYMKGGNRTEIILGIYNRVINDENPCSIRIKDQLSIDNNRYSGFTFKAWLARGCEVFLDEMNQPDSLTPIFLLGQQM